MDAEYQLEVLKKVHTQYAHYCKRYFGFTFKQISDELGVTKSHLSRVLAGKVGLSEAKMDHLKAIMWRLDIEKKFTEFKESNSDKTRRALNARFRGGNNEKNNT